MDIARTMLSCSPALLPGFGPILVFKSLNVWEIELRDDVRRIHRLECWNDYSNFELPDVWAHLSLHYNLHDITKSGKKSYNTLPLTQRPPWRCRWSEADPVFKLDWPNALTGVPRVRLGYGKSGNLEVRGPMT
ncbi:hypothetical protein C8R44DRAFT_742358 [Mycena epipterygia]|nr:hypothetical protein C8R44DRAFT_742358 [Mycena epipterygia]